MQPNINEVLKSTLNLSENQILVYQGFLKYGELVAADLSRKIEMDKSSTYRAVEELVSLGLLFKSPQKRSATYIAATPDKLQNMVEQKKAELEAQSIFVSQAVEFLKKTSLSKHQDTYIKVERGLEAHLALMELSLNSKEKLIREKFPLTDSFFKQEKYFQYVSEFIKRRVRRGISIRQLYDPSDKNNIANFVSVMKTSANMLKEVRILPKDIDNNSHFKIFDNTVTILNSNMDGEIQIVVIHDASVANLMKSLFDFIWEKSETYG